MKEWFKILFFYLAICAIMFMFLRATYQFTIDNLQQMQVQMEIDSAIY